MTTENIASTTKFVNSKYNLPNILSGVAIRFAHWCNKIALKFCSAAAALNRGQINYYENLKIVNQCTQSISKIIRPHYKKITTQLLDIKSWCLQQQLPFTTVPSQQQLNITKPQLIDPPSAVTHTEHGIVQLPDAYLAEIHQATVIGGSQLILTDADKITLNDEITLDKDRRYALKSTYINYGANNNVSIKYIKKEQLPVAEGIHFCHDFSHNYYHWLLECLPRLYIIDQFPHLDKLPLLVDAGLTHQQLAALKMLNIRNHPLITLQKGHAYQINKLFVPNMSTVIHDNYYSPVAYDKDVLISPTAINYVRDNILKKLGCSQQKGFRKIFISRKQSEHRRLLNLPEIENDLLARGFEVVFPEALTFANQVRLFAQAELVIGQTGAGFANLMWCPENCKAIFMINHNQQTNYYLFSVLTDILNIDLKFVPGTDVIKDEDKSLQNDFIINKEILRNAINAVM